MGVVVGVSVGVYKKNPTLEFKLVYSVYSQLYHIRDYRVEPAHFRRGSDLRFFNFLIVSNLTERNIPWYNNRDIEREYGPNYLSYLLLTSCKLQLFFSSHFCLLISTIGPNPIS